MKTYVLDSDKWKPGKAMFRVRQGGNGFGITENECCYTMSVVDHHIVARCENIGQVKFRVDYSSVKKLVK
ncbi:MAG: hypothetical protein MJZ81_09655 [Bacteroidales bacterium]|nr:hypothetical protein [Bacteroidales bacterium]